MAARACFLERLKATERLNTVLEDVFFSFEAIARSKSLLEGAARPLSVRYQSSDMFLFPSEAFSSLFFFSIEHTFDHAWFFFNIPFDVALLRAVHCFEL